MRAVFNKTKTKSWVKKAYKQSLFGYGYGYITDGYAVLVDEPHMHPTILEMCGTLTPECKYSAEQFQKMMSLPDEPIEVIDSQLEYVLEPKRRARIFYEPKTGKKLAIDSVYFDLLDNPMDHKFYTNDSMTRLWIVYDEEVVGVVAPLMNLKEKTMREEARKRIIECLKDGFDGYYCDLHHKVFNTDYYIVGVERAKEALKEYDVFKAIEKVQTYAKENFDEVYVDLSDPEKLINMLYYIIGEEVLWEMLGDSKTWRKFWDYRADEETNAKILEELSEWV